MNTPLRDWNSASYDPKTGRAAKSSEAPAGKQSADGESWSNSDQVKAGHAAGQNGAPGCGWLDSNRTQGGTKK
jgi:hypothetical protein